jgi:hypothetical protein
MKDLQCVGFNSLPLAPSTFSTRGVYMPFIKKEPLPKNEICIDPEHDAPHHMVLEQGYQYTYKCPSCGKETSFKVPMVIA